jgi:hypothetical protein
MNTKSIDVAPSLICFFAHNVICLCAKKKQLQMFQLYLYHELSSTQIVYSHYMPSFLHILKMMMNATMTLQPIVEFFY